MYRVYDLTTTLTASATTYATLIAALQAMTGGNFSITSSAQIVSTSANGHSVTFGSAAVGASPADYAENAAELRDLYTDSRAALISAGTITGATAAATADPLIWTEMMYRLQPIVEIGPSVMSALRTV